MKNIWTLRIKLTFCFMLIIPSAGPPTLKLLFMQLVLSFLACVVYRKHSQHTSSKDYQSKNIVAWTHTITNCLKLSLKHLQQCTEM